MTLGEIAMWVFGAYLLWIYLTRGVLNMILGGTPYERRVRRNHRRRGQERLARYRRMSSMSADKRGDHDDG